VLDPACGSGVFLVGAFRRLVLAWRSRHRWRRPDVETLKGILRRSIFGIELDPTAIDLTAFSLALAFCDALKPEVIWRELRFDSFRDRTLFQTDFFDLMLRREQRQRTVLDDGFDVIIGNPPFESKLTPAGERLDNAATREEPNRPRTPDRQAAYLFLEQALTLLRPGAYACLIQPSGLLYNRKAEPFCARILRRHGVEAVLDFTSIRNLYEEDPKTVAVWARAEPPQPSHAITHWTF